MRTAVVSIVVKTRRNEYQTNASLATVNMTVLQKTIYATTSQLEPRVSLQNEVTCRDGAMSGLVSSAAHARDQLEPVGLDALE